MSIDPAKLREEALRLPLDARSRLVAELLGSLDDEDEIEDPQAYDAAWSSEIAERLRAIDAGEVQAVPWNEARRRIVED
jgi:putative addiction module component (TIGR02574 family)